MKEAFSTLPALVERCCKMLLSSYVSCAGGHSGRQFGVGEQVCACEEGSCSEKEKHGNLLICRMETSEVSANTEHSKCGRKRGPCRAHGGDASLRESQWPGIPSPPCPVSPGHSWPAASCCWWQQPPCLPGDWLEEDLWPWGARRAQARVAKGEIMLISYLRGF